MKKLLLVLGMVTTILGLSACGQQSETEEVSSALITEDQAISYADSLIDQVNMIVKNGMEEQVASDEVAKGAVENWSKALKEMGEYKKVTDHTVDIEADQVTISAGVEGTVRNATVEIVMKKDTATGQLALSGVSTNITYTFAELMEKAALNTVIGMGTVFVVLILISLLISAFVLIPRIQNAFSKKPVAPAAKAEAAAPAPAAPAAPAAEEDLTDDLELVAVIAAAIAASEGAASTDGFVVRSIKRANTRKWQNA